MTAQRLRDCVVLDGADVVVLARLASAGVAALERSNGYSAGAQVHELVAVLSRTAADVRARSAMSAHGHVDDAAVDNAAPCQTPPEIGIVTAAGLLDLHPRTVRRKALGLGGRLVSGRWVFDRQVIEEAARERNRQ